MWKLLKLHWRGERAGGSGVGANQVKPNLTLMRPNQPLRSLNVHGRFARMWSVFARSSFISQERSRRGWLLRFGATGPALHVALAGPSCFTLASGTLNSFWSCGGRIKWQRVESVTSAAQTRERFIGFSSFILGKGRKSKKTKLVSGFILKN